MPERHASSRRGTPRISPASRGRSCPHTSLPLIATTGTNDGPPAGKFVAASAEKQMAIDTGVRSWTLEIGGTGTRDDV